MKLLFIAYDNGGHTPFPPLGILYLREVLQKEGHEVTIAGFDIWHDTQTDLGAALIQEHFDVVGLGFVAGYYQYRMAKKLSNIINESPNRNKFKFVLGGHGPAAAPEFFRTKLGADTVFVGEAFYTLPEYIGNPDKDLGYPGCVYCGDLINPDYLPLLRLPNEVMNVYRLIRFPLAEPTDFCFPILSGMGCKWKCSFCYRMDEGFRPRSPEATINEMAHLWHEHGINYFQFADELFMSSRDRVTGFCEALLESPEIQKIKNFKFDCNGRLNYAKPEILELMKRAGCQYVNYGIESVDQQVLNNINKGLTVEQITKGIEATLAAGLSPGLNFMWGNPGDTPDSLSKSTNFIIQYNPGHELRTVRPVTPYPGSPLFDEAVKRGMIADVEDFYENKHINSDLFTCNFMDGVETAEAHRLLYNANLKILKHHYHGRLMQQNEIIYNFYEGYSDPTQFRGFRDI